MSERETADRAAVLHREFEAVWGSPRGWRALSVVNHTDVGKRFLVTGAVFFLIAGLLAMAMRSQLAIPLHGFMSAEAYNQAFTMHGTMMMFLFAVPMLEGLAMYLLPKMLGARDMAFPRLSAFGYFCYLFGGIIFTSSIFFGVAPNSGWFMYTPLSSQPYAPGINSDFWLLGITFIEISAVAAGVELIVSILRTRAPGMALHQMPIFAWYMLVTSVMIVVGFPPLILGSILLELERAAGLPFFDVTRGGDPILWQHLFWLFGHPEVYIIFLPAAGIVSTVLPVFAQRPLVGYRWAVFAIIATGFISFGLWVHHMFTIGIPHLAEVFFSAASMLVAIPTGIQVFLWIATLWTGRPIMRLPMLWLTGFLVIFVMGGMTGVMVALVPFDWQVHDSHFVVAHFHYVLVGGMVFPLIAGLYYWMPHFSGRMPSDRLGKWGFWLNFIGFNGTFLIMHWTGLLGMPRRIYTYEAATGWMWPNLISSIFGFVLAAGIATVLVDFILHFRYGRPAGTNPWNADTLEWATGTPPASYNFASLPRVESRNPLWERPDLQHSIAHGEHRLAQAAHGRRETFGCDPVSGEPREIVVLPTNSWLPLICGSLIAVVCLSLLFKIYLLAGVAALAAVTALFVWSWRGGMAYSTVKGHSDRPEGLPLHMHSRDGPGRWGMGLTLLADAALYGSLVFGWLFLWTVSPTFSEGAPAESPLNQTLLLLSGALLTAGTLWLHHYVRNLHRGRSPSGALQLGLIAALGFGHALALMLLLIDAPLAPRAHAHDAVIVTMLGFVLLHGTLCAIVMALQCLRAMRGYVGVAAPYEPGIVLQLWWFTTAAYWVAYAMLSFVPPAFGAVQ